MHTILGYFVYQPCHSFRLQPLSLWSAMPVPQVTSVTRPSACEWSASRDISALKEPEQTGRRARAVPIATQPDYITLASVRRAMPENIVGLNI